MILPRLPLTRGGSEGEEELWKFLLVRVERDSFHKRKKMCMAPPLKKKKAKKPEVLVVSALVCGVASYLHLCVFVSALKCLSSVPADGKITKIERSVLVAYAWDLLTLALGIVPFSRAKRSSDVIGHHAPVFAFLFIGLPYTFQLANIEPAVAVSQAVPSAFRIFERINGWGFVSSLNEMIMCAQQSEIFLKRALTRKESKQELDGYIFTSKVVQLLELIFKLLVFTVFPTLSILGCLEYDMVAWAYYADTPLATTLLRLATSPIFLRTLAWRAFILIQYPPMAKRTYFKLKKHIQLSFMAKNYA